MAETTFHSITLPGRDPARVPLTAIEFNPQTNYKVRDYCTYQGILYRCTETHSAGTWNSTKNYFTATNSGTNVGDELSNRLVVPPTTEPAITDRRVGDLWIDPDTDSPVISVDPQPVAGSTNVPQSGGTFNLIKNLDNNKASKSLLTGNFDATKPYSVNQLCIHDGYLYRCKVDIPTGAAWNVSKWQATTIETELARIESEEADLDVIAETFGDSNSYAVGDYVLHTENGADKLYRCTSAVSDTSVWNSQYWSEVKLADEVSDLKSALKIEYEQTTVIKSSIWETGLMNSNGVAYPSYTSYKYSQQISVKPGDIVRVKKVPSGANIVKVARIAAFVNGTADSQYGANDDYTLPYIVPSPVSEIVFTIPSVYFDETDIVYSIDTMIAKSQFEAEIDALTEDVSSIEETIEESGEILDALIEDVSSIKEITEENSEILDALSDQVTTSEDKTMTWESGIMNLDGSVSANQSYIYSGKISVVSGQTVHLYKAGPISVSTATRITVYSDNIAKAEKGESDYLMPFIVPEGIDSIVFTIPAGYLTENVFARISSTSYVPVEKQTVDAITEYMSVKGEFYPLTEGSSKLAYAKGILGIWIKNPVEGEEYHLREFRYNQVIGSSKYTKFVIASVNDGVVTEHTIYTLGEYSPDKKIEFFDTDYALVCIDWSKYTSGNGYYAVNLDANTELDPSVTLESNTIAIACFGSGSTVITEEKLVTQVQQIVSVQKEIVESQVDVVDSARNAANHGVLPTNSGSTNFTNLQSLIDDGGTIVIDVPGIYEIDGMLKIGSDTELIFGKQVVMKMMNETGGFIVNKGASTNTYNTNIRISGLHLSCNGKGGDSAIYRRGLRGKIAFGFVKNLILDGIYCDDIAGEAYFIHLAAYENVLVENCHIEGNKDGVHSACGEHLTIRNCYFSTRDDPIALNCQDYVASIPYYGWIKDVLVENCVDESPAGVGGAPRARSMLVYGGAWTDWASGNTYRNGDTIVASNDCVYRLISDIATTDETVIPSTVEPTHLSGYKTESDGCTWLFIQDTPVYNVACENVTVRNYYIKCPRVEVVRLHNDVSRWVRSIYPTAIMPPHKNITLENVVIHDNYAASYFVGVGEPIDYLKIINSDIDATYVIRVQGEYTVTSANAVTNVVVLSNIFKKQSSSVLILSGQEDRVINVKAYGNYKNGTMYNSVTAGEVNMLANDLF